MFRLTGFHSMFARLRKRYINNNSILWNLILNNHCPINSTLASLNAGLSIYWEQRYLQKQNQSTMKIKRTEYIKSSINLNTVWPTIPFLTEIYAELYNFN